MHAEKRPPSSPLGLEDLRFDEEYWPTGSSEVMRRWLVEEYDRATMPPLVVSPRDDEYFVLGWDCEVPLLLTAHTLLYHEDRDGRCASDPKCNLRFLEEDEEPGL